MERAQIGLAKQGNAEDFHRKNQSDREYLMTRPKELGTRILDSQSEESGISMYHRKLIFLIKSAMKWGQTLGFNPETTTTDFMDDLGKLYLDYFQFHIDEVMSCVADYKDQLSFLIPMINKYYIGSKWRLITLHHRYCDSWHIACNVQTNVEAFKEVFREISQTIDDSALIDHLNFMRGRFFSVPDKVPENIPKGHWWWNEVPSKSCMSIENGDDPEYHRKLISLIELAKEWGKTIGGYKLELDAADFMDALGKLYLDYFQFHIDEAVICAIDYKDMIPSLVPVINEYYIIPKCRSLKVHEYADPDWAEACYIRTNIEAFKDLFKEYARLIDDAYFVECMEEIRHFYSKPKNLPKHIPETHWWWNNDKTESYT